MKKKEIKVRKDPKNRARKTRVHTEKKKGTLGKRDFEEMIEEALRDRAPEGKILTFGKHEFKVIEDD